MQGWRALIAVYGAGEAINGAGALAGDIGRQLERLARTVTNHRVAATAHLDAAGAPSTRCVLDPRGQQPVERLPNINTGDPAALVEFVAWSSAKCPAQALVLVLSGHGIAWQDGEADAALGHHATRAPGAPPRRPGCFNHPRALFGRGTSKLEAVRRAVLLDGHDRDYLSNAELGLVCKRIAQARRRPIDVLVLDACLMSAVEVLHELRGAVSTVVAAIDEISAAGIDMAAPAAWMTSQDELAPATIASEIVGRFAPVAAFDTCVAVDLAGSAWAEGMGHFRSFALGLLAWATQGADNAATLKAALRIAGSSVVEYNRGGLADVDALVTAITSVPGVPASATQAGRQATTAFRAAVMARTVGRDYAGACGLSLFAPGSESVYLANHADYARLQFPALTGWGALLDVLHGRETDATRLAAAAPSGFFIDVATLRRLAQALHEVGVRG